MSSSKTPGDAVSRRQFLKSSALATAAPGLGSTARGAITLALGSLLGLTAFFLDWFKEDTGRDVPFLMAAFYLFVVCSIILFIASLIRPHQHTEESERLVWARPLDALRTPGWPGLGDYRIIAGILFATMVSLYWSFR